jgi:serine/threonine-protein kinase
MTPDARALEREESLGSLIAAWVEAVEAGQQPDATEWLARHPEFAPELEEFFASQLEFQSLAWQFLEATRAGPNSLLADTPWPQGPALLEPPAAGRFGDYELGAEIGRGGMGVVYRARQVRLDRLVALKVMRTGPGGVAATLERFRHEAELIARLDHPAVVPIYEVGEYNGWVYYAMKLIEGGNLAQEVSGDQRSAVSAAERAALTKVVQRRAAMVVAAVARAVQHAHERGVLHRDLKPSNILLDRQGRPYVTDFGLGRQLEGGSELTQSGAIVGTPSYMAPEQASGRFGVVTIAADVYGLGSILYALLTGRPPFQGPSVLETVLLVREEAPQPPRSHNPCLARDLETICLKCLEKEPHRRYSSAAALADDLDRFLAGKPISARPVRPWERAWKWARRQPAAAALLAGSVLAVLGIITGVLVHNARLQEAAQEAQHQQELARAHYRRARDTLGRMLQQFDSYRLGAVPQFKELQRKQLEEALTFYEGALQDQDDPDPAVRLDTAVACKQAAEIQGMLGRKPAAAENYGRAIALLSGLPAEHRDTPESQLLLADCYNGRDGMAADHKWRCEEAVRDHRQALAILEALAQRRPHDLRVRGALAVTEHYLGAVYQVAGKPAEAAVHLSRAADLLAVVAREQPGNENFQARLADNQVDLALVYQTTKPAYEVKRTYEKTEELLQGLLARHPSTGQYTLSLAALYANWGLFLRDTGRLPLALVRQTRAVELAESVVKQEPQHVFARRMACNARGARAQTYQALGRWPEAAQDWDRVIELDDRPNGWIRRVLRALALARAGLHARAVAEAGVLEAKAEVNGAGRYDLACVYALAAKAARADTKLTTAEQQELAESHAGAALALLQRLAAQGYFRDAAHAKTLADDEDLQVLHSRPEFQKLLEQVKSGK